MVCTCEQKEPLESKLARFMNAQPSRSNGRILYYLAKEIIVEMQTKTDQGGE